MPKPIAPTDMMQMILAELPNAPDGQISEAIRAKVKKFNETSHSPGEIYDFVSSLAKEGLADISGFVQALCDLEKHYERPT